MNFYQHHIGDWLSHTAHLSEREDLAYRRMIEVYYQTESPLPDDVATIAKRIRMPGAEAEIQSVLNEFFTQKPSGWNQQRCNDELTAYKRKAKTAKENGKRGGRPKKPQPIENANENTKPKKTHPVFAGLAKKTQAKANQEPRTNNQEPRTNPPVAPPGGSVRAGAPPGESQPDPEPQPPGPSRPGLLSAAMRRNGIESSPHDPRLLAAVEAGVTPEVIEAASKEAMTAKPGERISPAYVIAIATRWTADAKRIQAEAKAPPDPGQKREGRDVWWTSDAGIERKARELGIPAGRWPDTYAELKDQCFGLIRGNDARAGKGVAA